MITIFRKRSSEVAVMDEPKIEVFNPKGKSLVEIVHQIHKEFEDEGDKFLNEVNRHLNQQIPSQVELQKLELLGFKNSPSVKTLVIKREELLGEKNNANQIARQIKMYPKAFKFLNANQVTNICKKWGLEIAHVQAFIKDVPKKNIDELDQFRCNILGSEYFKESNLYIAATPDCLDHKLANKRFFTLKKNMSAIQGYTVIKEDPLVLYVCEQIKKEYWKGDNWITEYNPILFALVTAWGPEAEEFKG